MRETNDGAPSNLRPYAGHLAANHARANAGGLRQAVPGDGRRAVWPGLARMAGVVSAAGRADENARPVSGGRQHPPGAGRAHGGVIGLGGS
jgi:hypothetical protein